jgi:hypothetical protein
MLNLTAKSFSDSEKCIKSIKEWALRFAPFCTATHSTRLRLFSPQRVLSLTRQNSCLFIVAPIPHLSIVAPYLFVSNPSVGSLCVISANNLPRSKSGLRPKPCFCHDTGHLLFLLTRPQRKQRHRLYMYGIKVQEGELVIGAKELRGERPTLARPNKSNRGGGQEVIAVFFLILGCCLGCFCAILKDNNIVLFQCPQLIKTVRRRMV